MLIGGFQKCSMIDYPNKLSAIVFTIGCNFKCPYCHNPELVTRTKDCSLIEQSFVLDFLKTRINKLDAIVISGGEPCLQKDLKDFIKQVKELGFLVKLDTNGSFPNVIKDLISDNLIDYIAMDIKSTMPKYSNFFADSKVSESAISESIKIIMQSGIDYEFRTTVCKELLKLKDFEEIGKTLISAKKYYLQKFVSSKHIDETYTNTTTYNDDEFTQIKNILSKYVKQVYIR